MGCGEAGEESVFEWFSGSVGFADVVAVSVGEDDGFGYDVAMGG